MAGENRTFTLVGKFDDRITPVLKKLNREISSVEKSLSKTFKGLNKDLDSFGGKGVSKLTSSLEQAGKAAGKVRDTVSQIGEGVKGLDGISESLEAAARAAGRAQEEVTGIGEAAGRANRQADDLMNTLLKAEGLSKFGDSMAQGFNRGMGVIMGTAQKGAGMVAKLFKDSMEDELSDIKAASGIQGSFGLAGYKGSFNESEKMYKKYDQVVSEMIRQSSAPTAKVVELQRYTLDTMGPLMLAAQGVKKGTDMKNIDPKAIEASATQYGQFLEKAALFSQGTGSAGFRVAAGLEGLVTRGKIDTTLDFFTDNIMLMKNLEAAGFAGRGMTTSKMMNATDAERMKAMMDAFSKSMSSESTAAMAQSLTGAMQGLEDTIFNPSVGILGMSVTFSKEEQKRANASIAKIQNQRIENYKKELASVDQSSKRAEELRNNIKQAEVTRDALVKDGADKISTPFKAFSYAFTGVVRSLTNALSAIGPVWSNFAIAAIEVTNKVFGPLAETLENVASDMRGGKVTQAQGFGRIIGEVFKTLGTIMADLAKMLGDPKSAMGKIQSEFMQGFMEAFKDPGSLEAARKGVRDGIFALLGKLKDILISIITSEEARPFVLGALALAFGPPFISAVIAGATPLLVSAIGRIAMGMVTRAGGVKGIGGALLGQAGKSAKAGAALPGAAKAVSLAGGAKMKGVGALAAGMVTLSTHAPKLQSAGNAVIGLAKRLPLLSIAFAGLDFASQKAQGKSNLEAGLSAGGGLVGGLAGAAIGQALIPIPGVGAVVGGMVGSSLGSWLGGQLANIGPALASAFNGLKTFFFNLPGNIVSAIGYAQGYIEGAWARFSSWFMTLGPRLASWAAGAYSALSAGWNWFMGQIRAVFADPGKYLAGAAASLGNAIGNAVRSAFNFAKNALANLGGWINQQKENYSRAREQGRKASGAAKGSANMFTGTLGQAINYEMKNKPTGSHLVVANSSETIIPAAGGLNDGGINTLINATYSSAQNTASVFSSGFQTFSQRILSGQQATVTAINRGTQVNATQNANMLAKLSAQNSALMNKISAAAAAGGGLGGGGISLGGGYGSRGSQIAGALGRYIKQTGGAPGSIHEHPEHGGVRGRHSPNSYHYQGRAIDIGAYANEQGGVLSRIAQFNQKMGVKPVELLKAGDPGHSDHVHVAYALGSNNPAFFSSQRAATAWENKMMPAGSQVRSVTSNTSESMGGGTSVGNINVTVNAGQTNNPDQLAAMVAQRLSQAIMEVRSASILV